MARILQRRKFLQTSAAALSLQLTQRTRCRAAEAETPNLCQSVRELGPQFLDNPQRITGQDGATSCRLPKGDGFWMFGDTIEGPFKSIRNLDLTDVLSNTAAIVPQQDCTDGIDRFRYLTTPEGKRARQVIEFDATEDPARHRLWPIHSVCVGDSIYAFYHKITMDSERDVFDTFELNGMGIARAKIGEYQFERLVAPDGSKEFWKGDQPAFGVFTEILPDGFLYVWGCYWTGMFLARTRPETIEDLDSYEYLVTAPNRANPRVAPEWSKTYANGAVLFDNVPNELSVSYNPHLKQHVAIHVWNRENRLVLRTAPEVFGPWSEPELLFAPKKIADDDLFTAGKEHPELRKENGRVLYVTYVNSSTYIPNLLEVRLR